MSLRLLYLIFMRVCGWLVPPGRPPASKTAALLVLRHEVAALRRTKPRARLGWAGPAGRFSPRSSGSCRAAGLSQQRIRCRAALGGLASEYERAV